MSMERSKTGKKKSPDGLSHPNQNTIIINIMWLYFIRNGKSTKKFNEEKIKWTWTIEKWKIIHPPPSRGTLIEYYYKSITDSKFSNRVLGADSQTCPKLSVSQDLSLSWVMQFKLCLGGGNLRSTKILKLVTGTS